MAITNQYKINVILVSIFTILTLLANFMLYRVSNHYLNSDEAYGVWLIILSIISWFYIMDFGISNSLRNFLTVAVQRHQYVKINEMITTTYVIMLVPLAILLYLGILANYYIDWVALFHVQTQQQEVRQLFLIALFMFPFVFYLNTITYIYHAYFKSYIVNIMQFLNLFVNTVVIALCALYGLHSLMWMSVIYFSTNIIIYVLFTVMFFVKRYRYVQLRFKFYNTYLIRSLLSMGMGFFLLDIASLMLLNSGPLLISYFFDPIYSVKFQLPYKLLSIFLTLSTIVLSPLWTLIITKMIEQAYQDIQHIHRRMLQLLLLTFVLMFLSTLILNKAIEFWIGQNYHIEWGFIALIALIVALSIVSHVYKTILNAMNVIRPQVVAYSLAIGLCLVLLFILLKLWHLGPYYFLIAINLGLVVPACVLPVIFHKRLNQLQRGGSH